MTKLMCVVPIKMLVELAMDDDSVITDWGIAQETIQATADFIALISDHISKAAQDSKVSTDPGAVFKVDLSDIMDEIYQLGEDDLTEEEQKAVDEAEHKDSFFIDASASRKTH